MLVDCKNILLLIYKCSTKSNLALNGISNFEKYMLKLVILDNSVGDWSPHKTLNTLSLETCLCFTIRIVFIVYNSKSKITEDNNCTKKE